MSITHKVQAATVSMQALKQRAFSLGAANAFDYALQFLLPVVLVRCLDTDAFGQYRLLWLAMVTVMVVVPMAMPQSLYYYLPRSDAANKRLYINQTLIYLTIAGVVGGWVISPWNPLLPAGMGTLAQYGVLIPLLLALTAASCLLD